MPVSFEESATGKLAVFAAQASFEDLPPYVVAQTKRVILDTIGCTFGGYAHEIGRLSRSLASKLGGTPEATIAGAGAKTSCAMAAFTNAQMANAMDSDETFLNAVHPASMVVWSALAVAERNGLSARDVLAAVAVGYDVAARVCVSSPPPGAGGSVDRKPITSGSWQVFGAVAAAGRLLCLDTEAMANAFGIAGMTAPMPSQTHYFDDPKRYSLMKYYPVGWTAQAGVTAALLAQIGFTGPLQILDGETGFWRMQGCESCDFDYMVSDLGDKWWIIDTAFKVWPSCRATHPYLTAFESLRDDYDLRPAEIERVLLRGPISDSPPEGQAWPRGPMFSARHPVHPVNMQFSLPFVIALAAHRITPGPAYQRPENASNPQIARFQDRIVIERDLRSVAIAQSQMAGPQPKRPTRTFVEVEITARGRTFIREVHNSKGDPWGANTVLTDAELRDKFIENAKEVEPNSTAWSCQVEQFLNILENFEDQPIHSIVRYLSPLPPET